MKSCLIMMAVRLIEMRRLLEETGSIYLHPMAGHWLRMLMDAVFGAARFRNQSVWKRASSHSGAKRFGPVHDTFLYYTVSERFTWNAVYQPHDPITSTGFTATGTMQDVDIGSEI